MTDCRCHEAAPAIYWDDPVEAPTTDLESVDHGDWKALWRCRGCGQLWALDTYDKYQHRVGTKVQGQEGWSSVEDTALRKALLLESRGGTEAVPCMWAGCERDRVKGVAFCLEHLWSSGARR